MQTVETTMSSPNSTNEVLAVVILGKDASNQDIIPIRSKLDMNCRIVLERSGRNKAFVSHNTLIINFLKT